MKDRTLIYISLAVSVIALVYAGWVGHLGSEVIVARALRAREVELVRHWKPKFEPIYEGILEPEMIPKNPTTLEELFEPLFEPLKRASEMGSGDTNKVRK